MTNDFEINENQLDREWIRQPLLIEGYLHTAAELRRDLDRKKNSLSVTEAQFDRSIRNDPDQYGLAKITEGAVSKTIILQEEYQEALTAVHDAKFDYDVAQAACQALDHKRKGLEDLVKLYGQQYFSTPQAEPEELELATKLAARKKGGVKRRKKTRE